MNKKELLAEQRMLLEALIKIKDRVDSAPACQSVLVNAVITDVKIIYRDVLNKVNEGTT